MLKFTWITLHGALVLLHGGEIAAGDRAGPGSVGAEALEIIEHLAHQRQQSLRGAAARETDAPEHLRGGFHESETVAGYQRARGMIGGLVFAFYCDGDTAQGARDSASDELSAGIAFDSENYAVQVWRSAAAEGLHGMKRADGGATTRERKKNGAVESSTGVQHNLTFQTLIGHAREGLSDGRERGVRNRQQDHI